MIDEFLEMLEFRRPSGTVYEEAFIEKYLTPLDPVKDKFGNLMVDIGTKPNILWSSHTDTVHHKSGLQRVKVNKKTNVVQVVPHVDSNCLGADCTTGVWIMMEMIRAGVEGRYIFHRAEEDGALGSKYIAMHTPDILKGIDAAVAFDRKGATDVITHQGGQTASVAFAQSLADILGNDYKPSSLGMFTDTKSYAHLVPECTNISVGYAHAHSKEESQNLTHLQWLRDQMVKFDSSTLVIKRTPGQPTSYASNYGTSWSPHKGGAYEAWKPPEEIYDIVRSYPQTISEILEETFNLDFDTLMNMVQERMIKRQALARLSH